MILEGGTSTVTERISDAEHAVMEVLTRAWRGARIEPPIDLEVRAA